jgi:mutator protein MutT
MPISTYLKNLRQRVGHELVLMPVAAAIVRDEGGRILLQRRSDNGMWSLPGGAIDPGEAPAQAVVREVYEETGLRVRPLSLAGVYGGPNGFRHTYVGGDVTENTVIVFECQRLGGELAALDGESLELRYFAVQDMPELFGGEPKELFSATEPLFEWDEAWLDI